jgi:hypothetical protein
MIMIKEDLDAIRIRLVLRAEIGNKLFEQRNL